MNRKKVAPELALAVTVSGSITIITSLVNIVLCVIAIIYRYTCDAGDFTSSSGAEYFMVTLYRVYLQDDSCSNSMSIAELTQSKSIFILISITLGFAVLSFILASAFIAAAQNDESSRYVTVITYMYIGVSISVLVVDVTFATHFGIDIATLADKLNESPAGVALNYETDILRIGALILMSITLKGYVYHIVNTLLLIYIVIYIVDRQKDIHKNEHNIHKLGVLNAYEYPRSHDDTWPTRSDMLAADVPRGSELLEQSVGCPRGSRHPQWSRPNDDEILRGSDNPIADTSNRPFERSESWLRSQPNPSHGLGNRPFSYLEEPNKRTSSSPKPLVPEPNWRRDWPPQPPVPAPDYSPPARRLKSALKQGYP